jgi:multidrug efflux pump subunit AcrA (membrane-fusion protein)
MKEPKGGDTRAKLIAATEAKVKEAQASLEKAKLDFANASTDEGRKAAQAALNTATAEAERQEKALFALTKPKTRAAEADDDAPTTRSFICRGAIRHNGADYVEGDDIELTKAEFDSLPAGSVA